MSWRRISINRPDSASWLIDYVRGAVEYAQEKGLRLEGIYDDPESCEDGIVQREIRLAIDNCIA